MIIFPAIDLREGKVVRLRQGNYDQMTVYSQDPLSVAKGFQQAGATHLHVVDLDGARGEEGVNFRVIEKLIRETGMFLQTGGGFREESRIKEALSAGASRVILGTVAVKNPEFVQEMVVKYGNQIAVGVDAKEGKVAVSGWEENTALDSVAFCRQMAEAGVGTLIYTDISKDGELSGTNLDIYQELSSIKGLNLIASGGITYLDEIRTLRTMVQGAILGKALYTGKLDLAQCIEAAEKGGK